MNFLNFLPPLYKLPLSVLSPPPTSSLTSEASLSSLQADFSTCALDRCSWTSLRTMLKLVNPKDSSLFLSLSLSLFSLFMSLVKFDPVNHVFILEVLSSLRDSFCDSRASWSSSSWWIFCSSQSPVLAPPLQLAPKIEGETPVLSSASFFLYTKIFHSLSTHSLRDLTYSFGLNCHLYAYGAHIHSSSPDFIPGLQNHISNTLLDIPTHILYNCFKFSLSKTELVFFTQAKPIRHIVFFPLVNNTTLYPVVATGKLTVIFDSAFSFFPQFLISEQVASILKVALLCSSCLFCY